MIDDWLTGAGSVLADASAGIVAVLITVAMVEGSGPREPGAHMLVTAKRQFDTIGGGHLEQRAVEVARAMLDNPAATVGLQRYALGPSLGQCCGGVVHLAFEPVTAALGAVLEQLRQRRRADSWRVSAIDGPASTLLFDVRNRVLAGAADDAAVAAVDAGGDSAQPSARRTVTHVWQDHTGRRWLIDPCLAPRAHLTLFGAGHVGAAIVRALAELPCQVTWVDQREDLFPDYVPANVTIEASDTPQALVAAAPAGSSFLVMTHSHALDQQLAEAIMARADVGWFGLIGSLTKRKQFEHRLLARGVPAHRLAAMVCPIGLAGITNKAPAVIAASVCAQLLTVWDAAERAERAERAAPALRLVASRAQPAHRPFQH